VFAVSFVTGDRTNEWKSDQVGAFSGVLVVRVLSHLQLNNVLLVVQLVTEDADMSILRQIPVIQINYWMIKYDCTQFLAEQWFCCVFAFFQNFLKLFNKKLNAEYNVLKTIYMQIILSSLLICWLNSIFTFVRRMCENESSMDLSNNRCSTVSLLNKLPNSSHTTGSLRGSSLIAQYCQRNLCFSDSSTLGSFFFNRTTSCLLGIVPPSQPIVVLEVMRSGAELKRKIKNKFFAILFPFSDQFNYNNTVTIWKGLHRI